MIPFGPARRLPVALVLLALLAVPARAQQKNLTLDDLYDPAKRVNFGSVRRHLHVAERQGIREARIRRAAARRPRQPR